MVSVNTLCKKLLNVKNCSIKNVKVIVSIQSFIKYVLLRIQSSSIRFLECCAMTVFIKNYPKSNFL